MGEEPNHQIIRPQESLVLYKSLNTPKPHQNRRPSFTLNVETGFLQFKELVQEKKTSTIVCKSQDISIGTTLDLSFGLNNTF